MCFQVTPVYDGRKLKSDPSASRQVDISIMMIFFAKRLTPVWIVRFHKHSIRKSLEQNNHLYHCALHGLYVQNLC
jgi:hypothetical protein